MTTKSRFVGILAVLVIIAAAAAVYLSVRNSDRKTVSLDLYFLNETATTIQAERMEIKYDYEEELPDKVIEALCRGVADGKNVRVMDKSVTWNISVDGARLLVDFSQDFLTQDSARNLLATYAVVKSLCQIDGIMAVKVTVEGGEIIAPDNSLIGYLTDKDINLESDSHTSENRTIKLYFADKTDGMLKAELRTVKVTDTVPIEQYIVSELIKGPTDTALEAVITSDTKILSVESTDGTAYINMSQSFIDKNSGSAEKENRAVYAIVNSVCELPEINSVQFLIDGKKTSGFQNVDLSGILYSRNDMTG